MKKSTIWILGIVMGLSFAGLLYLQISYIQDMVKMRNETFDDAVRRSLYQVSVNVELAETKRWLDNDVMQNELRGIDPAGSQAGNVIQQSQGYSITTPDATISAFEVKTITDRPSTMPKAMISERGTTIPQRARSLTEAVKTRYLYQRALLDEVVWQMLSRTSDKPVNERVNFKNLDGYLRAELIITISLFHIILRLLII